MSDDERDVRERAYRLWEQAGHPAGRSEEFWFLAQREIYGGAATSDGPEAALPPLADSDDE